MKSFLKIIAGTFIGCFIAMTAGFILLLGMLGSMAVLSKRAVPVVPQSAIMILDFNQPIAEQENEDIFSIMDFAGNYSASKTTGILDFIHTIDKAAEDPAIKFIYMNVTDISAGISHVEEIRSALSRFRTSGKPIIAYADNYSQGAYYLASVADKIYLNPAGTAQFTGLSMSTLFFKDLLDKIGIKVELIRHGKFKAAAEQFISNKMSDENREQLEAYLQAVWGTWMDEISISRDIPFVRLQGITDNLEASSAGSILELGLVDGLMYKDEIIQELAGLFGVEGEKDLKYVSSTAYSKATHRIDYKEKNKIAVVYANGDIVMGRSDNGVASDSYVEILADLRKDTTVKAVVLRINSPGGSAQSSEIIDRELVLLKREKPVIVSMGDYAASGGYWISANADKIYTNNTTLTGSIGVFSIFPNIQEALNKHLSVNSYPVNTNNHSDMFSGHRSLDREEVEFFRAGVEHVYNNFINLVSAGRSMSRNEVDSVAQGRVWAGADAVKIGLADEIGGLDEAIRYAAAASGIDSYRMVEYPVLKTSFDKILGFLNETKVNTFTSPEALLEELYSKLREEGGVKHLARLPFNLYMN